MIRKILLGIAVLTASVVVNAATPNPPPPYGGTYYDWGQGQNGFGYCYEFNNFGQVLWNGRPVANYYCEQARPSYYGWGQAQNGYTYCFQFTPYGAALNEGRPVPNYYCQGY